MKKVTISSKNISSKQWTNLMLELNLMKKEWKILAFGTKKYDPQEHD